MKKLKLNLANMPGTEVLTREQLKTILGGQSGSGPGTPGGDNGNPCPDNCTTYCHLKDGYAQGSRGTCPPDIGGTSCHNYCCEGNDRNNYYWC